MGCFDLNEPSVLLSLLVYLNLIIATCLIFILVFIKDYSNNSKSTETTEAKYPSYDVKEQLTSYELERLEREDEFDKRIATLKEEVSKQSEAIRRGVTADELHPLVHNLPHDAVQSKQDLYEEVAE